MSGNEIIENAWWLFVVMFFKSYIAIIIHHYVITLLSIWKVFTKGL